MLAVFGGGLDIFITFNRLVKFNFSVTFFKLFNVVSYKHKDMAVC